MVCLAVCQNSDGIPLRAVTPPFASQCPGGIRSRSVHRATSTTGGVPGAGRQFRSGFTGGGEYGELFGKLLGTTMGTRRALPVRGTDQHFAVALTVGAMKFVDRHGRIIIRIQKITKDADRTVPPPWRAPVNSRDKKTAPLREPFVNRLNLGCYSSVAAAWAPVSSSSERMWTCL